MTDTVQCASHEGESDAQPTSRPPSVDYVKIGGRCSPMQHHRRCATCTSPFCFDLEMQIVLGASFSDACERVAAAQVSETNLRSHVERKHLDLDGESSRAIQRSHWRRSVEKLRLASNEGLGMVIVNHFPYRIGGEISVERMKEFAISGFGYVA